MFRKINSYFQDWTLFEKVWLVVFTFINFYLFYAWGDTWLGLTASLTGMLCVVLTAKGKISNYYVGLINVILYAIIAYNQKYYGEVMLNVLYFVPMQFVGFFIWRKHKLGDHNDAVKVFFLSNKARFTWSIVTIIAVIAYGFVLKVLGGNLPFIDSISTVLSVIAMILMAWRFMEQWVLWIVVDVVSILMWIVAFMNTGNDITILVMWSAYLVNAIYGFINWILIYKKQNQEVTA